MVLCVQKINYKFVRDIIYKNKFELTPLNKMELLDNYCVESKNFKGVRELYPWGQVLFFSLFDLNKFLTVVYIYDETPQNILELLEDCFPYLKDILDVFKKGEYE